jgi:hypothetical protein
LFIINEQAIIQNMARPTRAEDLAPYLPALQKWMPKADIRMPGRDLVHFDGVVTWMKGDRRIRYLIEEKRHLRNQDVVVVVAQLNRWRLALPADHACDRLLLLAPHVRAQQAMVLERAEIDYLDLAGNVHLHGQDFFVHVEGRQPPKEPVRAPGRPQKGWMKAVMAVLIRPELTNAPYRALAEQADVGLATVAACMADLTARGLLLDGKNGRLVTDRNALIALWVQAYVEGLRPKLKALRFQVRAEEKQELWDRLETVFQKRGQGWALTGADAAGRRNYFFRAEETEIYAPVNFVDRDVQRALVAQPAVRGGNLLVIEPPGPLAIPRPAKGLPVAPDLLAYAELRYRATTQALEAAELLLPEVLNATH